MVQFELFLQRLTFSLNKHIVKITPRTVFTENRLAKRQIDYLSTTKLILYSERGPFVSKESTTKNGVCQETGIPLEHASFYK